MESTLVQSLHPYDRHVPLGGALPIFLWFGSTATGGGFGGTRVVFGRGIGFHAQSGSILSGGNPSNGQCRAGRPECYAACAHAASGSHQASIHLSCATF